MFKGREFPLSHASAMRKLGSVGNLKVNFRVPTATPKQLSDFVDVVPSPAREWSTSRNESLRVSVKGGHYVPEHGFLEPTDCFLFGLSPGDDIQIEALSVKPRSGLETKAPNRQLCAAVSALNKGRGDHKLAAVITPLHGAQIGHPSSLDALDRHRMPLGYTWFVPTGLAIPAGFGDRSAPTWPWPHLGSRTDSV